MGDILSFPELADATLRLHDIDETRLNTSSIVAGRWPRRSACRPSRRPPIGAAIDGADP